MDLTPMAPNPTHFSPVDVELREGYLYITPRRDFDKSEHNTRWAASIIEYARPPLKAIYIDLRNVMMISSNFFAGALQILDRFRNEDVNSVVLYNASDRIIRTIDMMNMRDVFVIKQGSQSRRPSKRRSISNS